MNIEVGYGSTIKSLQKRFHKAYPFLEIRFTNRAHGFGETIPDHHWYSAGFKLSTVAVRFTPAIISIQPWRRTGDVEDEFQRKFGVSAQIFRREEDQWIQTSATDVFTLDEQNETGKLFSEKLFQHLSSLHDHLL